jgi:hypothetical protein
VLYIAYSIYTMTAFKYLMSFYEFCYSVYNQLELFIYLDLMVKSREIFIVMHFKWRGSIKLV